MKYDCKGEACQNKGGKLIRTRDAIVVYKGHGPRTSKGMDEQHKSI